ncbi:LysM peptidoglycan-binding domain-containing protein [Cohnella fermenti]|nr:LysM peptidoglycan-binding domain-containing protein [Cohnella fermenti]
MRTKSAASGRTHNGYLSSRESTSSGGWKLLRTLVVAAAFLILFAGFSFMRSFADEPVSSVPSAGETVVIVDTGDTLWSIAAEVKAGGMDTREAVYSIMERNGYHSASLSSGDRLIIPVEVLGEPGE